MGELIILRHGETAWSRSGRHTGRTDLPLTERGEDQARALAPLVAPLRMRAFASPAIRAWRTAQLAGLDNVETDPDLW
jgi:broad specificity phosphatase PhoE